MALLVERWLECRVFTKHLTLAGVVLSRNSDAPSVSFTVEHNGIGTGSVTLPADHKLVPVLMAPGMRLQFRYLQEASPPEVFEQMSGPVVSSVEHLGPKGAVVTFTSISDEVLLENLAWPVPGNAITNQTSEYDTRTGAADGVVHGLVTDNLVTRMGLPVTMVPQVATGPTVTIKARFHKLIDLIRPVLEDTGRGIRLWQWNPGDAEPFFLTGTLTVPTVLCEIVLCEDRGYVQWTPHLGITSGTVSTGAPTATRVIVGGQGEGTARSFTSTVDATRETDWGNLGKREVFVDARDTNDAATVAQRATDALLDGAPKASLSVSTNDGEPWLVGHHYRRGDRVKVAATSGEVIAIELVRSITFTHDSQSGLTVRPQIGDPSASSSPDEVLARTIRNLAGRISDLESRR